ncbi:MULTISPECIES: glycosyltransferase [unclassified Pseudomonas]|uniref:glycosyltransferase n=1 Tax=unclassified Pseudomonas TaxID=196821 RepID=UPI000BD5B3B3|nr:MULTISPECIES: glycosyltransferase [unclassified Pseudomonas]PVZ20047.1 MGT family glycosyltransferase [Pseudomonas sp. URIL14HWK12:I12]PVZ27113.1 MGT family glycosyltransferase [Pseudomonas sp. URIL14HWK12:I10]PVZ38002.1 MGT family glycosyltransferase [Pseudomonas sp. URIL14HWK12:I11]SNZ04851.1 UDP-glucoronosyl and UDP-glucosyl transferase [Pseudomonas sp. URIL14HWK12:I9]
MSHFAVIAPPLFSHFRALQALAGALIDRGHRVTFVHQFEAASLLNDSRVGFQPVGIHTHPAGTLARSLRHAANPAGLAIRRVIADLARTTDMLCRELPEALDALQVDALICDQMEAAGGLVAEALGLPFVSVACALPVNREPGLPLPVMPFAYEHNDRARHMYATSERVYDWLMRDHGRVIAKHARAFGLPGRDSLHQCLSPLAQISQTLPALDFPRTALPAWFHAVGPLRPPAVARPSSVAWPVDPARPFVFASLGTLQGQRYGLFRTLAKACKAVDAQLLVAHCGGLDPAQSQALQRHGATWVTDFADQPQALAQAQAVITHGGLNTVMDAIVAATPILAVPIAFDQPGVAARVAWAGVGRRASRHSRSAVIAGHLRALLESPDYAQRQRALAPALLAAGGTQRAVHIVEQAVQAKRPVLAA